MTKTKLLQRLIEANAWIMGKSTKAPHWRTQKYLFENGYIDYTPTGWTYRTNKLVIALAEYKAVEKIKEGDDV